MHTKTPGLLSLLFLASGCWCFALEVQVSIDSGKIEGLNEAGVAVFKGIPFAAPPVGALRWKNPQPVQPWDGVRAAKSFGPRAMQGVIYSDKKFRDAGPSEDCLYLNVWTPAKAAGERLPVMVWIHGGGFKAGSGSEPDQDGGSLAAKGVVVVNFNYRLGVFGFLAHPDLTADMEAGVSGWYGYMDQVAALRWVQRNIASFGGDPANVTIFGESVGGGSVGLLMVSPLARGLFHKAISSSGGGLFLTRDGLAEVVTQNEAERIGARFMAALGAAHLAELRAVPAPTLLQASLQDESWYLSAENDGVLLAPGDAYDWYESGRQSHVPLLAGWNADERRVYHVHTKEPFSAAKFIGQIRAKYGPRADAVLRLYPAGNDAEAARSFGDLDADMFTAYPTWIWLEEHARAGGPAYRYIFDRAVPVAPGRMINGIPATAADIGAVHAAEIPYIFGMLDAWPDVPWEPADRELSEQIMTLWTNFAKTGDPNAAGMPSWPRYGEAGPRMVLHFDTKLSVAPETRRDRYEFWAADAAEARKEHAAAESTKTAQ